MPAISFIPDAPVAGAGAGLAGIQGVDHIVQTVSNLQQSQIAAQLAKSQLATEGLKQQQLGLALQLAQDPTSGALAQQQQNFQGTALQQQGLQQQIGQAAVMNPIAARLAGANADLSHVNAEVAKAYAGKAQQSELDRLQAAVGLTNAQAQSLNMSTFTQKAMFLPQLLGAWQTLKAKDAETQQYLAQAGEATARGALLKAQGDITAPEAAEGKLYGSYLANPVVPNADKVKFAQWYATRNNPNANMLAGIAGSAGTMTRDQVVQMMAPYLKATGTDPSVIQGGAAPAGSGGTTTIDNGQGTFTLPTSATPDEAGVASQALKDIGGINATWNTTSPSSLDSETGRRSAYDRVNGPLDNQLSQLNDDGKLTQDQFKSINKLANGMTADKAAVYKRLVVAVKNTTNPSLVGQAFVKQYGPNYLSRPAMDYLVQLSNK